MDIFKDQGTEHQDGMIRQKKDKDPRIFRDMTHVSQKTCVA